jgi:phosphoglycerate dehydrogenase-like enzyme
VRVACLPDVHAQRLVGDVPGVETIVWNGSEQRPPRLECTEFLVGSYTTGPLDAGSFALMPQLTVLQLISAGVDSWLPALPAGITVCNGRGVHGQSTAEIAVTLLLSQVRSIPRFVRQQAAGMWVPGARDGIAEKNVLMVGAGDIGTRVSATLQTMGATVTLMGRTARDGVVGLDELPALLPTQDAVVLAVPLTEQTRGMVDSGFLAAMKDRAVLVNVGRGPTVVTEALYPDLRSGRLTVALDVVDPEPLPSEHPLWRTPNVLLTPHVGGGTEGWDRRGYQLVREQLERWATGQPLENVVISA